MNKTTRLLQTTLAGAALILLSAGAAFAAPTLSISGPSTSTIGQTVSLDIVANGLSDLYGYQFDITFDTSKFSSLSATEGSFLSTAGTTFFSSGTVDNASGVITFVFDTLLGNGPGANGSGVLATFNFSTIGAGVGTFALTNVSALDSSLNDITVGTQSLSVTAAVPEPATWAVMLAGLAGLACYSRRRNSVEA